jgi:uncharacterized short protein YbdD (DUF466 family)
VSITTDLTLITEKKHLIRAAYPNWQGKPLELRSIIIQYNILRRVEQRLEANGWLSIYKHANTPADLVANNGVAIYKHTNTTHWPGTSYQWNQGLVIQLTPRSKNWVNAQYKKVRDALYNWCTADLNIGIDRINYRIQVAITAYPYDTYLHHLMNMHPNNILKVPENVVFDREFLKHRQDEELLKLEQALGANPDALFLILGA